MGEKFRCVFVMATSQSQRVHSSRRPSTRAGSVSDDVTDSRDASNSAVLSSENSFSDPVSQPESSQSAASKKKRGRPKKDKSVSSADGDSQADSQLGKISETEPEVWCCKICKLAFVDDSAEMMQCERCDGATCIQCLNMDSNMYDLLKGRMDLHWYCGVCDKQAMAAIRADWEIEEKCAVYMSSITTRMDDMQKEIDCKADKAVVDNICADVIASKNLIKGANDDIAKLSDRFDLLRYEAEEIQKRKKNLVIRGIPEFGKDTSDSDSDDDSTLSDLGMSDIEACKQLFRKIGVSATPKAAYRLGKKNPDGKPRPLKVLLPSEEDKALALKKGPKVRDISPSDVCFDPTRVFISPDMTLLQREEDVKLRKELKEKRQSDPNWVIKGKKVVRRKEPKSHPPDRNV